MKLEKETLYEKLNYLSSGEIDGSFSSSEELWKFFTNHRDTSKYDVIYINYEYNHDNYSCGNFTVHGVRLESDEEFEARKKQLADAKKKDRENKELLKKEQLEKDLAEYERLKQKLGKYYNNGDRGKKIMRLPED